jgi:hypothetical protein
METAHATEIMVFGILEAFFMQGILLDCRYKDGF